ncbi:MAG: putative aminohydrolase SsnA [Anaerolineales bacterium]
MLITNATLVQDLETVLPNHALRIEGAHIHALGPTADLSAQYPDDDVIDARGALLMPGAICAHTHFYGAYARGMAIPGPAPADFPAILRQLWWSLDKALDAESIRASARVLLLEAIKYGTTTLIDHHASPNHIDGSLDIIADAVEEAGLRAVLCYEVTDRDGPEKAAQGIAENVRFIKAAQERPTVAGMFGLHASMTLSDETLAHCAKAGAGLSSGFHIHVAEHEADEYDSLHQYGQRVVARLQAHHILGPKSIIAHAVHCNPRELDILRQTGTWVAHQPRSNMNNAVGAAPLDAMFAGNMRVCLGNDGFTNNLWEDWKAAYLLHKVAHRDPRRAPGDAIARMAMDNNARLAEVFFPGERLGTLTPGALADMVIVDYYPYTPLTAGNLPWHILFGFESASVRTTIANGQILMHDHIVRVLDERAVMAEALALAPGVWERYEKFAKMSLDS